jgi:hypothetical protein
MANVVVSAIATFNGKALKKGKKELSAFDKQAQQLGKTFNRVFATTAIVAFSKKAINAFAADEKAAKSLAVQLENTGNAFRVNEVETYIAGLQSLYGVLDDQLRPAFQTLLNATSSVTLSQQALETALNVSAGTGKDLESVVAAIAKGASGTTTALARLGTGLDKTTIASGDMNKIMAALDKKFAGQAQARLTTYAGKMDLLKVAAANATETIGKGLIDAISLIGKDNSIDQAANSMNNFATAIANTTTGMAELIAEVKKIIDSDVGKFLLGLTALLTLGKKQVIAGAVGLIAYDIGKTQNADAGSSTSRVKDYNITTKLFKARTEEYKIISKTNATKTSVEKLKEKFDLERIGLTAALNAATDDETRLRLRAQLAILDNDEAMAKKILAEMNGIQSVENLTNAFNNAAAAILTAGQKVALGLGVSPSQIGAGGSITGTGLASVGPSLSNVSGIASNSINQGMLGRSQQAMDLSISLGFTDTSNITDALTRAVAESMSLNTKNGVITAPAGFL